MRIKTTRRGALQAIVSLPVLGGDHDHEHEHSAAPPAAYTPTVFSEQELKDLAEWTDLMLPGAKSAGVPLLLDADANRRPETAKRWKAALDWFGRAAQGATKATVLARISRESSGDGAAYFRLLKETTVDLYYSTREGLQGDLGWDGKTYLAEFRGCDHPEHQG